MWKTNRVSSLYSCFSHCIFFIVCIYFYISFSFLETVGTFLSKISALMCITKIWRKCSLVRLLAHLVTIDTGYTFFFSLALFYFIFQLTSLSCGFNGHLLNLQCHFFCVCSGLFTDLPVDWFVAISILLHQMLKVCYLHWFQCLVSVHCTLCTFLCVFEGVIFILCYPSMLFVLLN